MTLQLVAEQTFTIVGRSGRQHVLTIWSSTTLGDWAAITINDVTMVEVTGDAVNRLTTAAQALAAQLAK